MSRDGDKEGFGTYLIHIGKESDSAQTAFVEGSEKVNSSGIQVGLTSSEGSGLSEIGSFLQLGATTTKGARRDGTNKMTSGSHPGQQLVHSLGWTWQTKSAHVLIVGAGVQTKKEVVDQNN